MVIIMYFKVMSYSALKRLYDYLDERFIPNIARDSLLLNLSMSGDAITFPLVLSLGGLSFKVVEEGSVEEGSLVVEVRTKEVYLNYNGVTRKLRDGLDIYPKFKRADWYSGKVAFKIEDFDTLEQFVGIFEPGEVKDFPETYNGETIYLTVKESNVSFHKERPKGMPCVNYYVGYTFPSALEVM
jgi:hypothetical protein